MKYRILMIITFSLVSIGLILSLIFSFYLSSEKIDSIDNQLRESALVLVNSNLSDLIKIDLEKADQLINNELGPNRIGKLFYVRNSKNEIVFKSKSATLVKYDFSATPKKYTIKHGRKTFRVLNLDLPNAPNKTLQVAIILDTEDIEIYFLFKKMSLYLIVIFFPIMGIAYLLTNYILKPLTMLSAHLEQTGHKLKTSGEVETLPVYFDQFKSSSGFRKDEFSVLINSISVFFDRLNLYYKITKPWSYQLAHEIKTPLSVLSIEIDSLKDKNRDEVELARSMKNQVNRISSIVSSFLDWATIDNSFDDSNLFAIHISNYLIKVIEDLDKIYPNRINLNVQQSFILICTPDHLIQVVSNIILNSLKHTAGIVNIEINNYSIAINDSGPGISEQVLQRYGHPFNFGKSTTKGNGLGLAWIATLSKYYHWDILFQKSESKFTVKIDFTNNRFGLEN